jgi:hypothetical protein
MPLRNKIHLLLCCINLLICFAILTDNYLLDTKQSVEICAGKTSTFSKGGPGHSGWHSYLITGVSGKEYNVAEASYDNINPADSFTIHQTALFNKVVQINFTTPIREHIDTIGVVSGSGFGLFTMLVCSTGSLLMLVLVFGYKKEIEATHSYTLSFIALVIIYFYFFLQT